MQNILNAIKELQNKVSYLNKDDKIETRKGAYTVITHSHVLKALREPMLELGLILIPEKYEVRKDGSVTTVNADYRLFHIESGESLPIGSVGQGEDTYDKGAGKATTYADKYVMMRLARIITGDDPDQVSNDTHDETHNKLEELGNSLINYVDERLKSGKLSREGHKASTDKVIKAMADKDMGALKEMAKKVGLA